MLAIQSEPCLKSSRAALRAPVGRRQGGFTIIELMITILVVAILAAIAVPSFDNLIKRNRIDAIQSQLSAALAAARTAATTRNANVVVCASDGDQTCVEASGSWSDGWLVFVDSNGDTKLDADEQVLEVFKNNNNFNIRAYSGITKTAANFIAYGTRGFLKGVQPTVLVVCEPDNDLTFARGLFVTAAGNVMKTRDGTDGNGIHQDPLAANTDLTCS